VLDSRSIGAVRRAGVEQRLGQADGARRRPWRLGARLPSHQPKLAPTVLVTGEMVAGRRARRESGARAAVGNEALVATFHEGSVEGSSPGVAIDVE
jgi:hypothetical protein